MLLQALFSRLLLQEPGNHLIYMTSCSVVNLSADRDAGEKRAIPYLYACYRRTKEEVFSAGSILCQPVQLCQKKEMWLFIALFIRLIALFVLNVMC